MSKKVSITLDDDILEFVDCRAQQNRSNYINNILVQEKRKIFMQELEEAYREQTEDFNYHQEISVWDATVGDALDA